MGTQITIADGQSSGTVTFTVVDDALDESLSETATVTISNPSVGLQLGSTVSQAIAIADNDEDTPSTPALETASDTGSSSSDGVTSDATPTFTGTATDGSTVKLFAGATEIGSATVTGGSWSITPATALADGDFSITAVSTDAGGNTSAASGAFALTVDSAAPSAPVVSGLSDDTGSSSSDQVTSDATPAINGTAEAGSTVEVFVDGNSVGTAVAHAVTGAWTLPFSGTALADASYSVTARATDAAGNVSPLSAAVISVIDTAAPSLSDPDLVDASDDGSSSTDNATSDTTPTIGFTAEAGATLEVDWGDGAGFVAASSATGTQQELTLGTAYASEGAKTVQLRATDAAGNASTKSLSLAINKKPTSVTLSNASIIENSAAGAVVGALAVIDSTTGDSHTLALTNDAGGLFALSGTNLVAGAKNLDFETATSHTVQVTATDSIGGQVAVDLVVQVTDDPEVVNGTAGNDTLSGSPGADTVTLGGGDNSFQDSLASYNGDSFDGFGVGDEFVFTDQNIDKSKVTLTDSSGTGAGPFTVAVDSDGDGSADVSFSIGGTLSGGELMVVERDGKTVVSYESYLPTLTEGSSVDASLVNGVNNADFLTGNGTKSFALFVENSGIASFNNALGVYEIQSSGAIVDTRMIYADHNAAVGSTFNITGVEAGHSLGFFIVQNGGNTLSAFDIAADTFDFVSSAGGAANADAGLALELTVNGTVESQTVFHSHAAALNADGLQHAITGVQPGGTSIILGFEDQTGGGDQDYFDVFYTIGII